MRRALAAVLLAVAFLALDTSAAHGQDTTRTIPSSVASDCSRDVTSAITNVNGSTGFLSSAPNGSVSKLQPNACYLVNANIVLSAKTNITVDLNGATIRHTTPPACGQHAGHFKINNSTGVTIRNGRLETKDGVTGYTGCHAFEHAIELVGGTADITVEDMTMDAVHGDCVYIAGVNGFVGRDVQCLKPGRQGSGVVKGTDILFDRYDIVNGYRSGIDFEPNNVNGTIQGVTIHDSDISVNNLPVSSQGRNAQLRDITIDGNRVTRGKGFVWGHQTSPGDDQCRNRTGTRTNWKITKNLVSGVGAYGGGRIVLCAVDGAEIAGNEIAGDDPVLLEATKGVKVNLNRFPGSLVPWKGAAQTAPVQACGNVLLNGPQPACSGTPPPSSTTTTTTKPPTPSTSTSTTTTTRPPVTTQPVDRLHEFLRKLQVLINEFQ